MGIVFQFFQLLPALSLRKNIILPMDIAGKYTPRERRERAMDLLTLVGLADQADKLPSMVSGGQQQRASVWSEHNGFRADAIRYAFAAGDLERTAALIERTWPELFYGVRPMTWLGWWIKPAPLAAVRATHQITA